MRMQFRSKTSQLVKSLLLALLLFPLCTQASIAAEYPRHLIVLIDSSGTMRHHGTGQDINGWNNIARRFLISSIEKLTSSNNGFGRLIYDKKCDYLSILCFGLPKRQILSFKKDFLDKIYCFKKGLSLEEAFRKVEFKRSKFAKEYTVLSWAAPLGFHATHDCLMSNTPIGETYILVLTDGRANWTPGEPSEISTLRNIFKDRNVITLQGEGFEYGETITRGIIKWYDFQQEVFERKDQSGLFLTFLIRVNHRATAEARSLIDRPRDLTLVRQGDIYKGILPIRVIIDDEIPLRPIEAKVKTLIGSHQIENKINFLDHLSDNIRIDIPVKLVGQQERGKAELDYRFLLEDPFYGKQLVKITQSIHINIKTPPVIFEPLGLTLPGVFYKWYPEMPQDELLHHIMVWFWAIAPIIFLIIIICLVWLATWPNLRVFVNPISHKKSYHPKFPIYAGNNQHQSKELLAVYCCQDKSIPRFGLIPTRKRSFKLKAKVSCNPEEYSNALGFGWNLTSRLILNNVYPNTEFFVFLDPSAIDKFPAGLAKDKIEYKTEFYMDDKNAGSHQGQFFLEFIPEKVEPKTDLKITEKMIHQKEQNKALLGELLISSSANFDCSELLNCTYTVELKRKDFPDKSYPQGIYPAGYEVLGDGIGEAKLSLPIGRYHPSSITIQGLRRGSHIKVPLYLNYGEIPVPNLEDHEYEVIVLPSQYDGSKVFPPIRRSLKITPDPRKTKLILKLSGKEDQWEQAIVYDESTEELEFQCPYSLYWGDAYSKGDEYPIAFMMIDNYAYSSGGKLLVRLDGSSVNMSYSDDRFRPMGNIKPLDLFSISGPKTTDMQTLTSASIQLCITNDEPKENRPFLYRINFLPANLLDMIPFHIRFTLHVPLIYRINDEPEKKIILVITFKIEKTLGRKVLGIDFGTAALACAFAEEKIKAIQQTAILDLQSLFLELTSKKYNIYRLVENPERNNPEAGTRFLPSSILVHPDASQSSQKLVDLPALRDSFTNLPGQVIPFLKTFIGRGFNFINVGYTGEDGEHQKKDIALEDIVVSSYERLFNDYLQPIIGEIPPRIVITYPNTFSILHLERLNDWIGKKFSFLDPSRISLVSESNAVACYYLENITKFGKVGPDNLPLLAEKEHILIYDLGAGTLDLTYLQVRRSPMAHKKTVGIEVLYRQGLPVAGNALDVIFARIIHQYLLELQAKLENSGIQMHYLNKIALDKPLDLRDEGPYRVAMLALKRQIQQVIKQQYTNMVTKNSKRDILTLIFPRQPNLEAIIEFSSYENELKEKRQFKEILKAYGVSLKNKMWNISVPREFIDESFANELIDNFLKTVVDNALEDFWYNVGGNPKIDTLIISGRASRFSNIRQRVVECLSGLSSGKNIPEPIIFDGEELKSCVAQGALLYEYNYKDRVKIKDRNLWGRYGFYREDRPGGHMQFVEIFGPDSFTSETSMIFQENEIFLPNVKKKDIPIGISSDLYFCMTFSHDPNRELNLPKNQRGHFWKSKFIPLRERSFPTDRLPEMVNVGMKVTWDDNKNISKLAIQIDGEGMMEINLTTYSEQGQVEYPEDMWPLIPLR